MKETGFSIKLLRKANASDVRMHPAETLSPAGEGVKRPCTFRKQAGNVNLKSDDVWICNSVNNGTLP